VRTRRRNRSRGAGVYGRTLRRALLLAAAVLGAAVVAGGDGARAAPSCPVSTVRYDAYGGHDHRMDRTPWLGGRPASSGLAALLWYWPGQWSRRLQRSAWIYTGGEMPQGYSTKVLWAFVGRAQKDRGRRALTVKGTRLDAHGSFTQRFGAISYDGQAGAPSFASIIDVPKAGCWRLDVSTAKLRASVVVRAITAPPAPPPTAARTGRR
jgi:hypothetical protein